MDIPTRDFAEDIEEVMQDIYDWELATDVRSDSVQITVEGIEGFSDEQYDATFVEGETADWMIGDIEREFGPGLEIERTGADEFVVRKGNFEEQRERLLAEAREEVEKWDEREARVRGNEVIDAVKRSGVEFNRIGQMDIVDRKLMVSDYADRERAEEVVEQVMEEIQDLDVVRGDVVEEAEVGSYRGTRNWVDWNETNFAADFVFGEGKMRREKE